MIPVTLPPLELHVHADRRLAFQVITAFGASTPGSRASTRIISREEGRLLVEFHTPGRGLLGRPKLHRTVEWVTLHEPHRVEFDTVEGPLSMMHDRFILKGEGGCTLLRYESEFAIGGWLWGWLVGVLYARPALGRLMREHMAEMKETIEARARRSSVYPQQPCAVALPEGRRGA